MSLFYEVERNNERERRCCHLASEIFSCSQDFLLSNAAEGEFRVKERKCWSKFSSYQVHKEGRDRDAVISLIWVFAAGVTLSIESLTYSLFKWNNFPKFLFSINLMIFVHELNNFRQHICFNTKSLTLFITFSNELDTTVVTYVPEDKHTSSIYLQQ